MEQQDGKEVSIHLQFITNNTYIIIFLTLYIFYIVVKYALNIYDIDYSQ